eukprot:CAMPEP_0197853320 /NCGR_PEP_ID=MMETSP1438-20131217/22522_1 /TAXON_ID=1461541 /ORGANISM="Pterosperma sp., Strain CCMP1384" /LENGTH=225 /DNA_ID=CAMNT_0043467691 /DNA_START=133 /DNA_END=810 /DNA_ORIENTATION=+
MGLVFVTTLLNLVCFSLMAVVANRGDYSGSITCDSEPRRSRCADSTLMYALTVPTLLAHEIPLEMFYLTNSSWSGGFIFSVVNFVLGVFALSCWGVPCYLRRWDNEEARREDNQMREQRGREMQILSSMSGPAFIPQYHHIGLQMGAPIQMQMTQQMSQQARVPIVPPGPGQWAAPAPHSANQQMMMPGHHPTSGHTTLNTQVPTVPITSVTVFADHNPHTPGCG